MKKIDEQLWTSSQGRALRQLGSEAYLLALYLLTNSHANGLGFYALPQVYIQYETGLAAETVQTHLNALNALGFCHYDETEEWIWVCEMAHWYYGTLTRRTDHRYKRIQRDYNALPAVSFRDTFLNRYGQALLLNSPDKSTEPSITEEAPNTDVQLIEVQTEEPCDQPASRAHVTCSPQVVDQKSHDLSETSKEDTQDAVMGIFNYWVHKMGVAHARLDSERRDLITHALDLGYTPRQLCEAIAGCAKTPFNMGYNAQGQKYHNLPLIFKNADQIDRFIQHCHDPPKPRPQTTAQANAMAVVNWIETVSPQT